MSILEETPVTEVADEVQGESPVVESNDVSNEEHSEENVEDNSTDESTSSYFNGNDDDSVSEETDDESDDSENAEEQPTEDVESEEDSESEHSEQSELADLLSELKFKSVDDLKKSLKEANKKITQQGQELSELKKKFDSTKSEKKKDEIKEDIGDNLLSSSDSEIESALEDFDEETASQIKKYVEGKQAALLKQLGLQDDSREWIGKKMKEEALETKRKEINDVANVAFRNIGKELIDSGQVWSADIEKDVRAYLNSEEGSVFSDVFYGEYDSAQKHQEAVQKVLKTAYYSTLGKNANKVVESKTKEIKGAYENKLKGVLSRQTAATSKSSTVKAKPKGFSSESYWNGNDA